MKRVTVFSTAALAVLLGIAAPVYAQDEHPQEEKRAEPDHKAAHEPDKQSDKQGDKDRDKPDRHADQDQKVAHQDDRHDQQPARSEGRQGGHIPDDRFRANFGRQHTFTIRHPVIVEGTPRFQYGGYWFVIVQPWPVGWAYTDVVYVDYIDGVYYLLSPVHPGVQISINVVL
jgi:hypothetical protein